MIARRGLLACALAVPLCWATPAFAGSYLNRAAILVVQGSRESEYLRGRVNDKDLAEVVHSVAVARLDAASRMQVPKEVVQAHPHLLLVLQNYERSADSAAEGHAERFLIYQQRDKSFSISKRGIAYFQDVATINQAVRGTVLLGITLIGLGVLVAAIGQLPRPARAVGGFLVVAALICAATYGTKVNVFGGAPSTSAILLVAAAFLLGASWAVSHVAQLGSGERAA